MRRIFKSSMVVLMCLVMFMPSARGIQEISGWAKPEVESAIQSNIVPQELQQDFKQHIKRHEYVLLALEIYESTYKPIEIVQKYPFYDIVGHQYEDEMVRAFAAGIIKGDGEGGFNPDGEITRQEVTSLVVNLIKSINSSINVMPKKDEVFSDQTEIAPWAADYIRYCYEQGIMKGVGLDGQGRSQLNPRGKASREEAIVLLYRLFNNNTIMRGQSLGIVMVVDPILSTQTERVLMESSLLDRFAINFDKEVARQVKLLNLQKQYTILELEVDYLNLEMPLESSLSLYVTDGLRMYGLSASFGDTDAEKVFKKIVSARVKDESIWTAYLELMTQLQTEQSVTIQIDDQYMLTGQVDDVNAGFYHVRLREKN